MSRSKQKATTSGKNAYSKSQKTSEFETLQKVYSTLSEHSLTRILYCPACLEKGRVSRTVPDPESLTNDWSEILFRCTYCKDLIVKQNIIGLDELLQGLFNMILVHKPPQELMEHIENVKYSKMFRRNKP